MVTSRHKVFVCYHHDSDEYYRKVWEDLFGGLFINKSVQRGNIDADNSAEYIKRLIQQNYLDDTSVLVVLVGKNTYYRKHVDWEISAALNKKVGGYSGLVGICLPTHSAFKKSSYDPETVPSRLADNLKSGYANFYDWIDDPAATTERIQGAFDSRIKQVKLIDNRREQLKRNRC